MQGNGGPILLLGANGQVGAECAAHLPALGKVVSLTRAEVDLSDAPSIRRLVRQLRPQWIVNCAAYTAVDKAESDSQSAFAINGDAPGVLGEEAFRIGAAVLHFSTDYVFAGEGNRPRSEDDPTGPLGVYGASKLAGEEALAASGAEHLIFRTSWVFGARGKNFLLTILKLAREREALQIVDDQFGAPTWSRTLAQLAAHSILRTETEAMKRSIPPAEALKPMSGVYHACSAGGTTWYGFASEFLRIARLSRPEQPLARLVPISSTAFLTAAKRPINSRLSCEKLERALGFPMPAWENVTSQVMAELIAADSSFLSSDSDSHSIEPR